jgi:hypothetical protein
LKKMPSAAALPNEPLPFPGCEVGYSPFLQQPAGQQPAQVPLSTNGYNTNIKQSFCQPQDQRPAIVTPPGYIPPKVDYATLPPPPEYSSSCSLTQLPMYQPQAASAPHYTYAPSASISNTTFVNVTNVSPAPYGVYTPPPAPQLSCDTR